MACFIVHIQQGLNADEISEKVKGWIEERLVNTPTPGQIEGWLILAVVVSWVGIGWVGKAEVGVSPILWPTTPLADDGAGWSDDDEAATSQITFRPLCRSLIINRAIWLWHPPVDCSPLCFLLWFIDIEVLLDRIRLYKGSDCVL